VVRTDVIMMVRGERGIAPNQVDLDGVCRHGVEEYAQEETAALL
jgi:hypothetical protein